MKKSEAHTVSSRTSKDAVHGARRRGAPATAPSTGPALTALSRRPTGKRDELLEADRAEPSPA
eukprot:CAMPEP_0202781476 /NCGR_PEP_ID=MMETSP1388-20130828/60823_1 /ASSEMBLY_ACC=CAM_ASM_000864 /TAXON_ID=37098 /ORGANISM="Isochrysis sp, Strain CCMP1244" /LENGTH=62 /DNA_ID=CAMNT_0049450883 /DNA_START=134 /DNA_END=319 /DNA_ORIENTATION=-